MWEEREKQRCRKRETDTERQRERDTERHREWGPELGRRKEREKEEEEERESRQGFCPLKGQVQCMCTETTLQARALPAYWACMQE